ncbi:hypothetical protein PL75_02115 [Neisseria arctica]|uniref:Esterase n=1 Tax=Neisseria arctica TaxID=1470200 RepID=A0A0J0YUD7_9NEIS|nr:alpha/beta hydrolase [Neisseria arctica]KLT73752.1 hypothetical protein PL75_02115 [Neisseria arctica]UOO85892.1 alpha/beta hydrolase [Neisseria arctica]
MTRRVFIIHGYQSAPNRHWFPWLKRELNKQNIPVSAIALPDSNNPDFSRWQQTLAEQIGTPAAQDYFVAHSLGCITVLHYLSTHARNRFGGLVLTAGFAKTIPTLPELDSYIGQASIKFSELANLAPIHSIISDNDQIIPPSYSLHLAEQLGSSVCMIPNGGHLMQSDGINELPQALKALQAMFDAV